MVDLGIMTKLLERAIEAARQLSSREQDDIARTILQLVGSNDVSPVALMLEEREAIAKSKAAAERDEFATDDEVSSIWAKHGR